MNGIVKEYITRKLKQHQPLEVQAEMLFGHQHNCARFYVVYTDTREKAEILGQRFDAITQSTGADSSYFLGADTWRDLYDDRGKIQALQHQNVFDHENTLVLLHGIKDINAPVVSNSDPTMPPTTLAQWVANQQDPSKQNYMFTYITSTVNGSTALWCRRSMKQHAETWKQTCMTEILGLVEKGLPPNQTIDQRDIAISNIFVDYKAVEELRKDLKRNFGTWPNAPAKKLFFDNLIQGVNTGTAKQRKKYEGERKKSQQQRPKKAKTIQYSAVQYATKKPAASTAPHLKKGKGPRPLPEAAKPAAYGNQDTIVTPRVKPKTILVSHTNPPDISLPTDDNLLTTNSKTGQIPAESNAWVLVTKGKKQKPKNSEGAPARQMNVNSNVNPSLETVAESDNDTTDSENADDELSSVPSIDTARSIYSQEDMDAVIRAHKKEIATLRVAQAVNLRNTEGKLNAAFEARTAALVTQSQKQAEDIASLTDTVQQMKLMISALTTTASSQIVVHPESALAPQQTPPRAVQLKRDTNNQEASLNITPSRAASAPKKVEDDGITRTCPSQRGTSDGT